ncbi:NUDIX domain-containing protein [Filobacillus milosensis]|uniref:NUDIX domain-containing protein n=1 Tax=Filobacillus milosensis TaxID=94137 RepID=A0A4Y8IPZ1_9BACI|nr:NUDIX domain-containing protein [Filobacillus milosensis]TFB22763.1 NUDIX domain-containing protein [Filobacillus milosensis]
MFYRRKTYTIDPNKLDTFNKFFHEYLYPNQIYHGAKLVGRWVNEGQNEIMAMWEYKDQEHYEQIEKNIRQTDLHKQAQERRKELGNLYIDSKEEFMHSTSENYHLPQHRVGVAGYITNEAGEVLLVRNEHRSHTVEIPGGLLEEGESLTDACHREIYEETGVKVNLHGVVGINQNLSAGNISVTFKGEYVSGELRPEEGETKEVFSQKLDEDTMQELITSKQLLDRTKDAMKGYMVPHQSYRSRPSFELVHRFEGK